MSSFLHSHDMLLFRMVIVPKCTTFVVQMGYMNSIGVHGILFLKKNQLWTIKNFIGLRLITFDILSKRTQVLFIYPLNAGLGPNILWSFSLFLVCNILRYKMALSTQSNSKIFRILHLVFGFFCCFS